RSPRCARRRRPWYRRPLAGTRSRAVDWTRRLLPRAHLVRLGGPVARCLRQRASGRGLFERRPGAGRSRSSVPRFFRGLAPGGGAAAPGRGGGSRPRPSSPRLLPRPMRPVTGLTLISSRATPQWERRLLPARPLLRRAQAEVVDRAEGTLALAQA